MVSTRVHVKGLAVLMAGALALAACGDANGDDVGDAGDAAESPAATEDATTEEATTEAATTEDATTEDATTEDGDDTSGTAAATVDTASVEGLGEVLVDGDGMTLYLFDNDTEDESSCVDDCAATWPPLTGEPEASGGADESLLGTITRPDGSTQVTYAGFPLYLYAADAEPGDVNGQGVGDVWWLVGADGSRLTDDPGGGSTAVDY